MENSASKNTKNGFWTFLFGKKKNLQKKNYGNRCENCQGEKKDKTVQTNNYLDNKEEENIPILNINTYSNAKEMQKNKNCPGKVFPLERRGCGFHLYFCIDSMQRSGIAKNKKNRYENCETNKLENIQNLQLGKKSVVGDNEVDSMAESVRIHQTDLLKQPSTMSILNRKINLGGRRKSPVETVGGKIKVTTNKIKETDTDVNSIQKTQEENKTSKTIFRKTSSKSSLMSNFQSNAAPSYMSLLKTMTVNEETTVKVPIVRISSVPETQNEEIDYPRDFILSDQDTEAMVKGLDILQKQKLRRKSSMRSKTGSTFVRNSLISIRKERRSSVDSMVPQILLKLSNIEGKIAELEKVYEDRGKNIMNIVGISCNNAKSTLSIDIKDNDGKKDMNKQPSPETSLKTTVVIKSRGEDIVVNDTEKISVTKKSRNRQESNQQLVYHNTQELDAHSIASNSFSTGKSRTIKHQKQKSGAKGSLLAFGDPENQASDKWRRISEELKF